MDIRYLVDCKDAISLIARWLFDEWGRFLPGSSFEGGVARLHERLHCDQLPLTLVAMEAGAAIGTVSLIPCDMETRPDLSPSLASLYVAPDHRRCGIGSALIEAAVREAKRVGIDSLFLFTDSSQALYAKHGWQTVESCLYRNRAVVIMRKSVV
ncbi:putative Acetyltransferase, N-acetylglutamate synthase [Candidatus Nitrospira nitrosa]|uniref:Putative Acetyltransferase, N-acetylglutamate synthase n=1 Tax=Candidatus Nitrospira nitrosa TaxID=1742972 RepID=A0A0S4LK83_9BACT|nr:GNAT family N-acetyltransferase [Candidatus Nitrospira nitrosa]CUS37008.1 putative Acetyltransferase, N-acetylglutamate synthase [Candidatus Nitrospira nitrosa]